MAFWIPLILAAAGAGASYAGQRQSAQAQANVWSQYRSRNKKREAEAAQTFDQNLAKSGADTAQADMDAGAQQRENVYAKLNSVSGGAPLPTAPTANSTVATPTLANRALVKNSGSVWNKMLGKAEAKLGSLQDWQLAQNVRNNRTEQELNRITQESKGDLNNVVPVELSAAAHKGDALQGWGTLLSAAGMISGVGGALSSAPGAAGKLPVDALSRYGVDYGTTAAPVWGGL